jgi:prepilin-type N-terminal cleavage/methylation domain-containing protein
MRLPRLLNRHASQGFTLIELLIAVSIATIIVLAGGEAILGQLRGAERAEVSERQRADWSRVVHFIESEVALSEQLVDDASRISIPPGCGISAAQFRLALDLRRDLPPVIYGVQPSPSGWVGSHSLVRCGPSIGADGTFLPGGAAVAAVLLDGLDGSAVGNGFTVALPEGGENKLLRFTLALRGLARSTYSRQSEAHTRINPLYPRPGEGSLCQASNLVYKNGTTGPDLITLASDLILSDKDVLICGRGGGDQITGSAGNDILEASATSEPLVGIGAHKATLRGGLGNDHLRGTTDADLLEGGCGDDVLVGRGGTDQLRGGPLDQACTTDRNLYLPGVGVSTITGGIGLDVVFFNGPVASYSLTDCVIDSCVVSGGEPAQQVTMVGVEVLIFKDGRIDLEN